VLADMLVGVDLDPAAEALDDGEGLTLEESQSNARLAILDAADCHVIANHATGLVNHCALWCHKAGVLLAV